MSDRCRFPPLLRPVRGADIESHEASQQRAVVGGISTYGTSRPRLVRPRPFENANASREWNSVKGPQLLRLLAGQALHVTHCVGHREQTRANRLQGSILP